MIDINELKQGDLLTICEDGQKFTVEFMERSRLHSGRIVGYDLSNRQYVLSHISKESINDYCTSWKRDGVELLKQEEEKPLYVFCPIEKTNDGRFIVNLSQFDGASSEYHVSRLDLMGKAGDYTFIGYSQVRYTSDIYTSPTRIDSKGRFKVMNYAVFMLTSQLFVGGE